MLPVTRACCCCCCCHGAGARYGCRGDWEFHRDDGGGGGGGTLFCDPCVSPVIITSIIIINTRHVYKQNTFHKLGNKLSTINTFHYTCLITFSDTWDTPISILKLDSVRLTAEYACCGRAVSSRPKFTSSRWYAIAPHQLVFTTRR